DGRVMVAGNSVATLYDPGTRTWRATREMVEQRYYYAAMRLPDGTVLVAGGSCCTQDRALASAELFDPATGTFRPTGPMKTGRSYATAIRLQDGRVLVAGGSGAFWADPVNSTEIYDPATGGFTDASTFQDVDLSTVSTVPLTESLAL